MAVPPQQGNGLAVAGMVLGILGLVLCWVPFIGWLIAVVGVILGAIGWSKANKTGKNKGMAIAGVVCGIVGLAIGVIFLVMAMTAVSAFGDYMTKAKTTEASLELRSIETKIKSFYNEKARLPASAQVMPGPDGSACSGPMNKIERQPQSAWEQAGWGELGFFIDEDSRYSYHWDAQSPTSGVARAVADLDCDGTFTETTMRIEVVDGNVTATYSDPTPD